jgi:hypothetical protein
MGVFMSSFVELSNREYHARANGPRHDASPVIDSNWGFLAYGRVGAETVLAALKW